MSTSHHSNINSVAWMGAAGWHYECQAPAIIHCSVLHKINTIIGIVQCQYVVMLSNDAWMTQGAVFFADDYTW